MQATTPPAPVTRRKTGRPGSRDFASGVHEELRRPARIVREALHVEALTIGAPAAAKIDRVHRKTFGHELLGDPKRVVAAMGVEAGNDGDDASRLPFRAPRPDEYFEATRTVEGFFVHRSCLAQSTIRERDVSLPIP